MSAMRFIIYTDVYESKDTSRTSASKRPSGLNKRCLRLVPALKHTDPHIRSCQQLVSLFGGHGALKISDKHYFDDSILVLFIRMQESNQC